MSEGVEVVEGRLESDADVAAFIDQDGVEEGLVEQGAAVVGRGAVEVLGSFQQGQGGVDQFDGCGEFGFGLAEFALKAQAVVGDLVEPLADLAGSEFAIGGEVKETFFLDVEASELTSEVVAESTGGALVVVEGVGDGPTDGSQHFLG